jgi:molecular chaperone GrpE
MRDEQEEAGHGSPEPDIDPAPGGTEPSAYEAPEDQDRDAATRSTPQTAADWAEAFQKLQADNQQLHARNLELLAEMIGYRQRLDREKEEFKKYAVSAFAGDILAVEDNIGRALDALPVNLQEEIPGLQGFVDGVVATERVLLHVLNRHQVTRFIPLGEPFNPHLHDAKTMVNAPDMPPNTVVHVLCAGYMIGERVLRAAEVAVAQGGEAHAGYDSPDEEADEPLFRRPGFDAPVLRHETPHHGEDSLPRKSPILQKAVISPSDGIPAATHPIWERLVTGQVKHRFNLFAANLLVDRARREYASNRGAKTRLASEICTFCNRYASILAADLEPVAARLGRIPPASHPVWELLVTGQIRHGFKLFAANLLVDRARREYTGNRAAKPALAAELCRFFNEHADSTAHEFETIVPKEATWLN